VDGIINLPKAKTHTFMGLTGAVKNLFGFIPGLKKVGFHGNLMEPVRFAEMLLDLVSLIRPNLTIMDGIVGMDGDGPSAGRVRPLGFLLMGRSPVHVDWGFSRMVGVAPERIPVLKAAQSRGWITPHLSAFESIGAGSCPRIIDFRLPKTLDPLSGLGALPFAGLVGRLLAKACSLRPWIPSELCERCGTCARSCPAGAIEVSEERTWIDDARCIRCYCCHETCPKRIVELRGSLLYRMLSPLSGRRGDT
jgi:ferredoxin